MTSYDVCIDAGTGIKECILAASLTIRGFRVLQLDTNRFYGGHSATIRLDEFSNIDLCNKLMVRGELPLNLPTKSEVDAPVPKVYIDLSPRLLFSSSELTDILTQSGASAYMEFTPVTKWLFGRLSEDKVCWEDTPVTRSAIFKNANLERKEKRALMTFFTELNQKSSEYIPASPKPFNSIAQAFRDSDTIMFNENLLDTLSLENKARVIYGVALVPDIEVMANTNESADDTNKSADNINRSADDINKSADDTIDYQAAITAISTMKCMIESIGRFCKSPLIYPNFGTGDIPQALSRFMAIRNGVTMLDTSIIDIVPDVLPNGGTAEKPLRFLEYFNEPTASPDKPQRLRLSSGDEVFVYKLIRKGKTTTKGGGGGGWFHRFFLLTSSPVLEQTDDGVQLGVVLPNNANPIHILQVNCKTGCVPSNSYGIYFSQRSKEEEGQGILYNYLRRLVPPLNSDSILIGWSINLVSSCEPLLYNKATAYLSEDCECCLSHFSNGCWTKELRTLIRWVQEGRQTPDEEALIPVSPHIMNEKKSASDRAKEELYEEMKEANRLSQLLTSQVP